MDGNLFIIRVFIFIWKIHCKIINYNRIFIWKKSYINLEKSYIYLKKSYINLEKSYIYFEKYIWKNHTFI